MLMKKSTIWVIAALVGFTFATLLFLQAKYFEEVIAMRREQFNESVTRSLYQAARILEMSEMRKSVEESLMPEADSTSRTTAAHDHTAAHTTLPSLTKDYFLNRLDNSDATEEALADTLRQRISKQDQLNNVISSILYQGSDKPLAERIDFRKFDSDLRQQLRSNGISIDYHFYVTTSDDSVIYRCPDFVEAGDNQVFRQLLFPKDPPAQTGLLYIHFPEMRRYLLSSVRFMTPAIFFTFLLLLIFIFTIWTIFRQKRLTEIKNDFINNMTHEFKTPISTISLAAQMLRDPSVTKSEAMFNHISGIIVDETKRLRFQVEKVLQMSMFDRKAATFKQKELNANALIEDIANTFRLKVEADGGHLTTNLEAENAEVFVDEMHFTNVIFNLMDNAVKYKSPDRQLQLSVTTKNDGNHLLIRLEDNGIGIRKEDLKKIFEKFYRVHTGNRHDVKGFGLGLAYVRNIVQAHGGTIHAESTLGRGTRFIISLPLIA